MNDQALARRAAKAHQNIERSRDERGQAIVALREAGWTYQAIATQIGLTKERIHQIVVKEADKKA